MPLISFDNQFGPNDAIDTIVWTVIRHPFDYFMIMTRLGYKQIVKYEQTFDGGFYLYRGLSYNIMASLIDRFVRVNVLPNKTLDAKTSDRNGIKNFKKLILDLIGETLTRFAALCVSYPFRVMTVRMCAQIVGREHHYDSILSAVTDIYQTGGVTAFYAGFVPHLLADCLELWGESLFMLNSRVSFIGCDSPLIKRWNQFNKLLAKIYMFSKLYRLRMVSPIMCCNGLSGRSLLASTHTGPDYRNWIECWQHLSNHPKLLTISQLVGEDVDHINVKHEYTFGELADNDFAVVLLLSLLLSI